jgi:hypothetical protein
LFATDVRASGVGLCYAAGRLSNMVSPFLMAAILTLGSDGGVFAYVAGCWVAVLVAFSAR